MQDPQMQATAPGNPVAQLVAVAAIRAFAIYRDLNPPVTADPDLTVRMTKPADEAYQLNRIQADLDQRLHPHGATRQALALIGRLGDAFEEQDAERAVESVGLVIAHAAVLAWLHRMAIGPIIDLAIALRRTGSVEPLRAAAMVARAVNRLHGVVAQRDRDAERMELVAALGMSIAKAIDDSEIGHDLVVHSPRELLERIAAEVCEGKLPRDPGRWRSEDGGGTLDRREAPTRDNRPRPVDPDRKAAALAQLQAAADELEQEPGPDQARYFCSSCKAKAMHRIGDGPWKCGACASVSTIDPDLVAELADAEQDQARAEIRMRAADAALKAAITEGKREEPTARHRQPVDPIAAAIDRELEGAAKRQAAEDEFMATLAAKGFAAAIVERKAPVDPASITGLVDHLPRVDITSEDAAFIAPSTPEEQRLGVSAATVCPQCAAPMAPFGATRDSATSDPHGTVYRCDQGHEINGQQLQALAIAQRQQITEADRVKASILAAPKVEHPAPVSRSGRHLPPPRKPQP